MPRKCCVRGCRNREGYFSLHKFPPKNCMHIYDQWIVAIQREDIQRMPFEYVRKTYRVCESHFKVEDYRTIGKQRPRLKFISVPKLEVPPNEAPTPRWKRRMDETVRGNVDCVTCTPKSHQAFRRSLFQEPENSELAALAASILDFVSSITSSDKLKNGLPGNLVDTPRSTEQ